MTRSSTAEKFISDEITQALIRAGLGYEHPIRRDLDARAEIVGLREIVVRVRDERNQQLMLEDRIAQLRHDPRFAASFPVEPPKLAKGDMRKLSENFDKGARRRARRIERAGDLSVTGEESRRTPLPAHQVTSDNAISETEREPRYRFRQDRRLATTTPCGLSRESDELGRQCQQRPRTLTI